MPASATRTSFSLTDSLPQATVDSIIEAPGKVVVHVRVPTIHINIACVEVVP